MKTFKNFNRLFPAILATLLAFCVSKAEAQTHRSNPNIEYNATDKSSTAPLQQYAPPSTSPNSIQIGVPQVYYYYAQPYPYAPSPYAAPYGTPYPTTNYGNTPYGYGNQGGGVGLYNTNGGKVKPSFWYNQSFIPGQSIPYNSAPNSIGVGSGYPYGY